MDVADEESMVLLDNCKVMHALLKNPARLNQNQNRD
jgi:hypothetical protein